jgi:hypothetical protein
MRHLASTSSPPTTCHPEAGRAAAAECARPGRPKDLSFPARQRLRPCTSARRGGAATRIELFDRHRWDGRCAAPHQPHPHQRLVILRPAEPQPRNAPDPAGRRIYAFPHETAFGRAPWLVAAGRRHASNSSIVIAGTADAPHRIDLLPRIASKTHSHQRLVILRPAAPQPRNAPDSAGRRIYTFPHETAFGRAPRLVAAGRRTVAWASIIDPSACGTSVCPTVRRGRPQDDTIVGKA